MNGLFYCEHCRIVIYIAGLYWAVDTAKLTMTTYTCPVCERDQKFYSVDREP